MNRLKTWLNGRWRAREAARINREALKHSLAFQMPLSPKMLVAGGAIKTPARKWR